MSKNCELQASFSPQVPGATENAGVENVIRAKSQGGKCRSEPYGTPNQHHIEKALSYLSMLF